MWLTCLIFINTRWIKYLPFESRYWNTYHASHDTNMCRIERKQTASAQVAHVNIDVLDDPVRNGVQQQSVCLSVCLCVCLFEKLTSFAHTAHDDVIVYSSFGARSRFTSDVCYFFCAHHIDDQFDFVYDIMPYAINDSLMCVCQVANSLIIRESSCYIHLLRKILLLFLFCEWWGLLLDAAQQ